ncbi:hypothetical protein Hanom_Chr13g01202991 [Helianthus anomalus]
MIRILDPMWLVNYSDKDVECLFFNKICYESKEKTQAMQYQGVVNVCYAYGINSGKMWQSKWRELEKEEFPKEQRRIEKIKDKSKEARPRRFQFMKWAHATDQTLIPSEERRKPRKNFFGS